MQKRRRIVVRADWYSQLMLTVIAVSCAALCWRLCGPQLVPDQRIVIFRPAPFPVDLASQTLPIQIVGVSDDQALPIRLLGIGKFGRLGRSIPVEVMNSPDVSISGTIDVNVENDLLSVQVENDPLSVQIQ